MITSYGASYHHLSVLSEPLKILLQFRQNSGYKIVLSTLRRVKEWQKDKFRKMFPTLEIKFVGLCLMHLVFRQIRNVVNCLWAHTAFMIMLFYAFNGFYRAMVYSAITGGGKVKKAREGWVWSTQTPSLFSSAITIAPFTILFCFTN